MNNWYTSSKCYTTGQKETGIYYNYPHGVEIIHDTTGLYAGVPYKPGKTCQGYDFAVVYRNCSSLEQNEWLKVFISSRNCSIISILVF